MDPSECAQFNCGKQMEAMRQAKKPTNESQVVMEIEQQTQLVQAIHGPAQSVAATEKHAPTLSSAATKTKVDGTWKADEASEFERSKVKQAACALNRTRGPGNSLGLAVDMHERDSAASWSCNHNRKRKLPVVETSEEVAWTTQKNSVRTTM